MQNRTLEIGVGLFLMAGVLALLLLVMVLINYRLRTAGERRHAVHAHAALASNGLLQAGK